MPSVTDSTVKPASSRSPLFLAGFAAVALLALVIRLFGLTGEDFWFDEGYTIFFTDPGIGSIWDKIVFHAGHDPHPFLYFALIDIWRDVSMEMAWLRLSSVLFMMVALVFLWRIGNLTATPLAALIGLVYFAVSRTSFQYSVELRMYGLGCMFAAISIYYFLRLMTNEGPVRKGDVLGLALANGFIMLSHYTGAFLPMCEYGALLIAPWVTRDYTRAKERFIACTLAMVGSAFIFFPQLPWFLMQGSAVGEFYWIQQPDIEFFFVTMHQLLMGRPPHIDSTSDSVKVVLFYIAVFAMTALSLSRICDRRMWILICCGFGPLVVSWVYSQVGSPVFLWRSFLYTLLPFSVMLGMLGEFALEKIRAQAVGPKVVAAGVAVLLAFVFAFNAHGTRWDINNRSRTNYDAVVADVEERLTDNTLLVFTPNLIVGAFYYAARDNEAILAAPSYQFPVTVHDVPGDGADPGFIQATEEDWDRFREARIAYDRILFIRRPPGEPPVNPGVLDEIATTHLEFERIDRYGGEVDIHVFDKR